MNHPIKDDCSPNVLPASAVCDVESESAKVTIWEYQADNGVYSETVLGNSVYWLSNEGLKRYDR